MQLTDITDIIDLNTILIITEYWFEKCKEKVIFVLASS